MKLKATIISLVSVLVIGLTAILIYCFWPAIQGTVESTKYYTAEELQDSYDSGYEDGCKSETELTSQVKYYKNLVDEYNKQVKVLNTEVSDLNKKNNNCLNQIQVLNDEKNELTKQVKNLKTLNTSNESTITSLENKIKDLEKQISELSVDSENSTNVIKQLNEKIKSLQSSVSYYENYIATLESENQVVATFEYDNSVLCIQVVNKGSKLSVSVPEDTEYMIFNGWKIDDKPIDLETYTITSNIKIVADITYKYNVKFMVDITEHNTQTITQNEFAILPSSPTKTNSEFKGWSKDGITVVENIESIPVTEDVTYVALFTNIYKVTFMVDNAEYETQSIKDGECPTLSTVPKKANCVFLGWSLNGSDIIEDIHKYIINNNTSFIAVFKEFSVIKARLTTKCKDIVVYRDNVILTQLSGTVISPQETNFETLSTDTISISFTNVNNILTIKTDGTYSVETIDSRYYISWSNASYVSIRLYNDDLYDTNSAKFVESDLTGINNLDPQYIWSDGFKTFYSNGTEQYVLNSETSSWESVYWTGCNLYGNYVWTDGTNIFYTYKKKIYTLDISNFKAIELNLYFDNVEYDSYNCKVKSFDSTSIWTDGIIVFINCECIESLYTVVDTYMLSSFSGSSIYFKKITSSTNNIDDSLYGGANVFKIGCEVYYSDDLATKVFDKLNKKWIDIEFSGLTSFYGKYVWTDGVNTYYSLGAYHYILDTETLTWKETTWNGLSEFDGDKIWTDGSTIYYSYGNTQCKLLFE